MTGFFGTRPALPSTSTTSFHTEPVVAESINNSWSNKMKSVQHMQKGIQKGFTLIELMIVIAIIGVLAAIAMPAYQDYVKRAHVTEGLNLASAAEAGVATYFATEAAYPNGNAEAGLATAASIAGKAVKSVSVGSRNGQITITFNSKVDNAQTIILAADTSSPGSIQWSCSGGTLSDKYRPARCR